MKALFNENWSEINNFLNFHSVPQVLKLFFSLFNAKTFIKN